MASEKIWFQLGGSSTLSPELNTNVVFMWAYELVTISNLVPAAWHVTPSARRFGCMAASMGNRGGIGGDILEPEQLYPLPVHAMVATSGAP